MIFAGKQRLGCADQERLIFAGKQRLGCANQERLIFVDCRSA